MFSHSQLYLDQNSSRGENVETEEGVEETSASRTFAFLWTIFGKMCKLPSKKPEKRVFHYSDTKKNAFVQWEFESVITAISPLLSVVMARVNTPD